MFLNIYEKIVDTIAINKSYIISLDFDELINNTTPWCFNRKINDAKVDELYNELCDSYNIPYILHAIYDKNYVNDDIKILILDGQHRLEAVKKYLNQSKNPKKYYVWICIYEIDDSETINTDMVIELFRKINNNRVIEEDEVPDTFIINLINKLCTIASYKKCINTNENTSTCHSPNIHKKELNRIFNENKKYIKNGNKLDDIIANIIIINNKIASKRYDDLYDVKNRMTEKNRYEKAVSKNFFLNLKNSFYSPNIWIKYINNLQYL